jgi:pimeloyl-ACP methyl ester carboxylesterase
MSISETNSLPRHSIETSVGPIAYAEAGSGPLALFIHGVFLNADLWHRQLADLGDLRRCVAVDLLAHGGSCLPASGPLSVELQAEMIVAFLDALGAREFDLVANDTGGAVAQLVATAAPARVRSLVLTNCDTHDNWPPAAIGSICELARQGALADALPALARDAAAARAALASGLEDPDSLPDALATGFFSSFTDPARARAVQDFMVGMNCAVTVAIEGRLSELAAPTLIVWGTADVFFDVSWSRWLERTIPGTRRRVELDGAKLFLPLERANQFNAELRSFWTEM